jgi:hypothetical protein
MGILLYPRWRKKTKFLRHPPKRSQVGKTTREPRTASTGHHPKSVPSIIWLRSHRENAAQTETPATMTAALYHAIRRLDLDGVNQKKAHTLKARMGISTIRKRFMALYRDPSASMCFFQYPEG